MWRIIKKIAIDLNFSKIIFLLDALDEYEVIKRIILIKKLVNLEYKRVSSPLITTHLKVFVISQLIKDILSIKLKGDEESKAI